MSPSQNNAIGVIDSGVGGISVLKCIRAHLLHENLIYVADSKFAPYGEKSNEEITRRVLTAFDFLNKQDVKCIVVACNTATAYGKEYIEEYLNLFFQIQNTRWKDDLKFAKVEKFIENNNGIALLVVSRSNWFKQIWRKADAIIPTPPEFKFERPDGSNKAISFQTFLFGFGDEAIIGLGRLEGRVR